MKLSILKAKVKRNKLIKHARKFYVDETSDNIKQLNLQGERALLGIKNNKGVYTIIGEQCVHYFTSSGKSGKILLKDLSEELFENGCRIGAGYLRFKFLYKKIVLSNSDKVWLHNSNTMFSLWNTILWLQKLPSAEVDTNF